MYPHIYVSPRSAGRFNDRWPFGKDGDLILSPGQLLIIYPGDWQQVMDFRDVIIPATAGLIIINPSTDMITLGSIAWQVIGVQRNFQCAGQIFVRSSALLSADDASTILLPSGDGRLNGLDEIDHTILQKLGGAGNSGATGSGGGSIGGAGGSGGVAGSGGGGGGGGAVHDLSGSDPGEAGQPGDDDFEVSGRGGDSGASSNSAAEPGGASVGDQNYLSGAYGDFTDPFVGAAYNGNNGHTPPSPTDGAGGSGGGGGAKGYHGGLLAIIVKYTNPDLTGSIDASGANGGNGGNGAPGQAGEGGEGGGAGGGAGGSGGKIVLKANSNFVTPSLVTFAGGFAGSGGTGASAGFAGQNGVAGAYQFIQLKTGSDY